MSFLAAAAPAIGAVSGIGSLLLGAKSISQASKSAPQVNIDQLNQQARAIAIDNARASAELERQMTPEVPALRTRANEDILRTMGRSQELDSATRLLAQRLGSDVAGPTESALLNAAANRAQSELGLGAALPQDVRNEIMRAAAARSGTVSDGLGLGRDISARDLGLSSLQLLQQRLQNASQIGQQQLGQQQFNVGTNFNNQANLFNTIQALQSLRQGEFARALGAGQYGQAIAQPVVGIDPSSVANIAVGNVNAQQAQRANLANVYGQMGQNLGGLAGNLIGYSMMNYKQPQVQSLGSVTYSSGGYTGTPSFSMWER